MPEIAISVRRTDRTAELVRLIRPITRAPVHEISSAASGSVPLLVGELFNESVEEQITSILNALREGNFRCWISVDGDPTEIEVVENMIRSSSVIGCQQQLLGFLESPDSTFLERLQIRLELIFGSRWLVISALITAGMGILLFIVLLVASGR